MSKDKLIALEYRLRDLNARRNRPDWDESDEQARRQLIVEIYDEQERIEQWQAAFNECLDNDMTGQDLDAFLGVY